MTTNQEYFLACFFILAGSFIGLTLSTQLPIENNIANFFTMHLDINKVGGPILLVSIFIAAVAFVKKQKKGQPLSTWAVIFGFFWFFASIGTASIYIGYFK